MNGAFTHPGFLRGPDFWARRVPQLSRFAPDVCRSVLKAEDWQSPDLIARARAGITALLDGKIGGDCWTPSRLFKTDDIKRTLVIAGSPKMTVEMLAVARTHARADQIVLALPARSTKKLRRRLALIAADQGVMFATGPLNAWDLLDNCRSVVTEDHEIGFLALLRGLKVRCHGRPFYAGWGLTEDNPPRPSGSPDLSLEGVFAASCLLATDYRNPHTGSPCSFEDLCAILSNWRTVNDQNRRIAVCLGMSFWKQRRMRDLLSSTDRKTRFTRTAQAAIDVAQRDRGHIAVWATREPPEFRAAAKAAGVPVIQVEDGFIRSVGLGADFTAAASIVLDRTGIYFDPSHASGLDLILANTIFDPQMIERSRRMIEILVERGITKYNIGASGEAITLPQGRRAIFVPGQVENDRSVALGGAGIYRNIDLLRKVRALNPAAYILYKSHPDVDAGHRPGAIADSEVLKCADDILRGISTAAIIPNVDEIHTLTSLAGFEALIRRKTVVAYGQPFYAGWGLTTDIAPVPHRGRHLSLEELVAGALIIYPRYFDPMTRLPCGPELIIDRLAQPDIWRPGLLSRLRHIQGRLSRNMQAARRSTGSGR